MPCSGQTVAVRYLAKSRDRGKRSNTDERGETCQIIKPPDRIIYNLRLQCQMENHRLRRLRRAPAQETTLDRSISVSPPI